METYDVRKIDPHWKVIKEGSERALRSFQRKTEAVTFARDYVQAHGGRLRIWSADGSTLQQDHSYAPEAARAEPVRAPRRGLFHGISEGAADAAAAAGRLVPAAGRYLSRGAYRASYYGSYGVVLAAVTVGKAIPMPASLARGLNEGTEAAMEAYEKGHPHPPTGAAAA